MFDEEQKQLLEEPLDPRHVKKRKGADQRQVSYVEGWQLIQQANTIFGFGNWSSETVLLTALHEPKLNVEDNVVVSSYMARVRVTVHAKSGERSIVREGSGAARGFARTAGEAAENAIKGAETDALKRAFRTFGNVFGLALYDREQRNVGTPRRRRIQRPEEIEKPLDVGFAAPNGEGRHAIAARGGNGAARDEVPF